MKKTFPIFLLLISIFSCSKNDFYDTKLYFVTDKEIYRVNNSFKLTIFIYPTKKEKTIRFNKNLNNLNISFMSTKEQLGFNQELKKHFIEGPRLFGDDSKYIDEYIISMKKPFKKTLNGTITELKNKIVIKIPELKISDSIDKSILIKNNRIIIKGNCRSVYGSEVKSFIPKGIQILIE